MLPVLLQSHLKHRVKCRALENILSIGHTEEFEAGECEMVVFACVIHII